MDRLLQEFYCNECRGYFRVKINTALNNYKIIMVCPNCQHEHYRMIVDGHIEDKSDRSTFTEKVRPPKSAYSKHSIAKAIPVRDGAKLTSEDDYKDEFREAYRRNYLRQRYLEAHGEV